MSFTLESSLNKACVSCFVIPNSWEISLHNVYFVKFIKIVMYTLYEQRIEKYKTYVWCKKINTERVLRTF